MAHEMFVLLLLGWGPSWKGKSSEIFPFSCSPAFLHTPSEAVRTFLVAAHLAQFRGDSTTLPGEFQNSLGWKRPLKIIWSIHLLKPGLTTVRTGCSGLCPAEFWPSPRMEIPRPVWAMCSSIWPNSPRIFSQYLIENFHGKALPFTLHLHLLLHSDTAGDNMRIPPQLSLLQAEVTLVLLHYVLQPPAITELTQQWEPWSCMSELSLSTLLPVRSDMCRAKETSHIALVWWRRSPLCF